MFFFGHLSLSCYVEMLLYLVHIAHRSISIRYELPKILIIHGSNLYIAVAARAEELLGQPMHTMLHQSKVDATPHPWEACPVFATLTTGTVYRRGASMLWHKDGTPVPMA